MNDFKPEMIDRDFTTMIYRARKCIDVTKVFCSVFWSDNSLFSLNILHVFFFIISESGPEMFWKH